MAKRKANGAGRAPAKRVDNPPGQWNYLEVRVKGNQPTVWLNGAVVVEKLAIPDMPVAGGIRLQTDGAGVQFRNVRVAEVKQ